MNLVFGILQIKDFQLSTSSQTFTKILREY